MAQDEAQMSDIVVVIDDSMADEIDKIADRIKTIGCNIEQVDHDEGVIEGTLPACKLPEIKSLPGVKYVRCVFNYEAELNASPDDDESIPR
jgi:hypothetical protein